MEIELKIVITEKNMQKFLSSALFRQSLVPNSFETLQLTSVYYDTLNFALKKDGIAYRVRSTKFANGKTEYESTVKRTLKKNGGMAVREETNTPQEDDKPCYENVQELFRTQVERKIYLLIFGGAVLEMAADKGKIIAKNGREEKIDEVEFEVKKGNEDDLQKFRDELLKIIPLQNEERSKYARGLALLQKEK